MFAWQADLRHNKPPHTTSFCASARTRSLSAILASQSDPQNRAWSGNHAATHDPPPPDWWTSKGLLQYRKTDCLWWFLLCSTFCVCCPVLNHSCHYHTAGPPSLLVLRLCSTILFLKVQGDVKTDVKEPALSDRAALYCLLAAAVEHNSIHAFFRALLQLPPGLLATQRNGPWSSSISSNRSFPMFTSLAFCLMTIRKR